MRTDPGLPPLGAIISHLVEHPDSVRFVAEERRFVVDVGVDVSVDVGVDVGVHRGAGTWEMGELMAHVRRLGPGVTGEGDIAVSPAILAMHRERFFAEDGRRYRINATGLYRTQGKGNRTDEGVAGDALSLRHYTSFFFYPMNAFYRLDFASPSAVVGFGEVLSTAGRNFFRVPNVTPETEIGRNVIALLQDAMAIEDPEDPRLWRLLQEQLVHNLMAHRCLMRQEAFRSTPGGAGPLYRITALPEGGLSRYRRAVACAEGDPAGIVVEDAFTSTSPDEPQCERYSRRDKHYKFIITTLGEGTSARWLDAAVDDVVNFESEVLFPPGSRFRVTGIEEDVAGDTTRGGDPRTWVFLQEVSPLALR